MDKNITIGQTTTQQLTQHPSVWIERLAQFGYAAKGAVYGIVAAAQAAFGAGGKTTDTQGALKRSDTAIWKGIVLGLVNRSDWILWRFVQASKTLKHRRQRFGTASRLRSQQLDLRWFSS